MPYQPVTGASVKAAANNGVPNKNARAMKPANCKAASFFAMFLVSNSSFVNQ